MQSAARLYEHLLVRPQLQQPYRLEEQKRANPLQKFTITNFSKTNQWTSNKRNTAKMKVEIIQNVSKSENLKLIIVLAKFAHEDKIVLESNSWLSINSSSEHIADLS